MVDGESDFESRAAIHPFSGEVVAEGVDLFPGIAQRLKVSLLGIAEVVEQHQHW